MKWLKDDLIHFLQDLEDQNPDWILNLDLPEKESEIEKFYREMVEWDKYKNYYDDSYEDDYYDHCHVQERKAYYKLLDSWMYYGWEESEDQD